MLNYLKKIEENEMELIKQYNNHNSYSDLYIVDNEVYKIYTKNDSLVKYNYNNIKYLLKNKEKLKDIKELVLPNSLLYRENELVGFSMPYIMGIDLYDFLDNSDCESKTLVFEKIYNAIKNINDLSISLCDFHEKNIIIDNKLDIHFIDCDSFVINGKEYNEKNYSYYGKYIEKGIFNGFGFSEHNINSDYYCLFMSILNYIVLKTNIYVDDILKEYFVSNNNSFNKLIRQKDINKFTMSLEDLDNIITNMNNISFKEKYYVSDEEINNQINKIRKLIR